MKTIAASTRERERRRQTNVVSSTGATSAAINLASSLADLRKEREEQARLAVESMLVAAPDLANVLAVDDDMAGPVFTVKQQVLEALERHISSDTSNDDFGGLVMARSHTDSARHFVKEHDMYGPIQKLITFIADQVVLEASSVKGCKSVRRLLRFNEKTDRKPVGSDDDKRPD
ncbi:hypothetical protein LPJ56_004322, partial [Coemansia sp. RSA 2599]